MSGDTGGELMIHTRRRALLSLEGSYYGNSLAGLSIGASDNREQMKTCCHTAA